MPLSFFTFLVTIFVIFLKNVDQWWDGNNKKKRIFTTDSLRNTGIEEFNL